MVARERHRHHRQHVQLAVAGHHLLPRRADGEDRGLRRVEDRDELVDVVHAEVGDREGPAFEILGAELAVARAPDEVGPHLGDLRDRQPLGAVYDGDDEPLRRRDRNADVGAREDEQRIVRVLHVHVAVAHQRLRADLGQNIGDGDAHVGIELALPLDELVRARHVDVHRQLERRHGPCLRQPAGDRLADVRERTGLDRFTPDLGFVHTKLLDARDVHGDDTPVRSGAANLRELDAALACDAARER